jgi:hypothetical protein
MRNAPAVLLASVFTLALLARGPAVRAQPTTETGVAPVLHAASSALGATNLKSLPAFHATATGTAIGLPAQVESYTDLAARGTFASYVRLGGFTQDSGFDGRSAWSRDSAGVVWVDGSEQGHAAAANEAYRESYALWTPSRGGAAVALLAPQSEGGRSYDVVRVTPAGSVVPFDVWIDRATYLPARYVETAAAITTTTLLSDYRTVAGVKLPFAVHQTSNQGNETTLHVTRVEIVKGGVAAKVRKPDSRAHDFSIAGGSETSVPFDLIDNHVYLDVTLNGKGPYRFIFDTGGQNVVDPAVAREIGAVPAGSAQGGGVGSTTETFSLAPVASLRVGSAELRDQLFGVAAVRAGFGMAGSAPVDGLIGAEVLARFVTVFDYEHKLVTFKLPGAALAGTRVPFVFDGTQPEVPCVIDGLATRCTIDSGSRSSLDLFAPFLAAHPSLVPAGATAPGINGFGVGGGEIGRLGRLPSLAIGGLELKNFVAGLSTATVGAFAVPGIAANIGGAVLKRFTVTYDYAHEMMSLEPNAAFAEPDSYERSGMFMIDRGGVLVVDVRPGTPAADAGIVKGDAIESVDGEPAERLRLGGIREAFRRPSGTQLELQVRSKGASSAHKVLLTLRDYV